MTALELNERYEVISEKAMQLGLDVMSFESPEACEAAIAEEESRLDEEKRREEAAQADIFEQQEEVEED